MKKTDGLMNVNSIIGEGTRFKGEFELNGVLRIDGDFQGIVKNAARVLVGKNGRAEAIIHANEIFIGGIVKGDIYAMEYVKILASGILIGNIITPKLNIEEGVIFHGRCKIIQTQIEYTKVENVIPYYTTRKYPENKQQEVASIY